MKEQLYTIPVNDAFQKDCECSLCAIKYSLEEDTILYTMGSSYMEDDIRAQTDKLGFCSIHLKLMYENQNRLGFAHILNTHVKKTNREIEKRINIAPKKSALFSKKTASASPILSYIHQLHTTCFVCNKINHTFDQYVSTIFYLYKTEPHFVKLFNQSKGFCMEHYGLLLERAPQYLKQNMLEQFTQDTNTLYLNNMKRLEEELDWFIDKFDYRNSDAPWKNSKDSLIRGALKVNSTQV